MKTVAIHQPNYLPWLGYFHKLAIADVFVILDTAQFAKNGYQNRVQIKTSQGPTWLSQPVSLSGKSFSNTSEIGFANPVWKRKHLKTLQANYAKAPHFRDIFPKLEEYFGAGDDNLATFNTGAIELIKNLLGVTCEIRLASDLPSEKGSTERLVELIQWVGGDRYYSGKGGVNYQDEGLFEAAGINLEITGFKPSEYSQLHGEFVPGLSIVDYLFNCGTDVAGVH